MRRQLTVFLLLALALCAQADGYVGFTKNGLAYTIVSDKYRVAGVAALEQQESAVLKEAVIPKRIWHKGRHYKVMIIGDGAFGGCWQLKHVELPDCVTTLGKGCFAWCIGLEEITLPASVCVIGADAFSSCPELKSIYVPAEHVERVQQLLPKELRYLVKPINN
jgi:hypothetical protein